MGLHQYISISALLLLHCLGVTLSLNSLGREFVLVFLNNDAEKWQNLPLEVHVINYGSQAANVAISAPRSPDLVSCTGSTSATIPAGTSYQFGVCWWSRLNQFDPNIVGKTIRIIASKDVEVIAVNKEAYTADSFLVLPISSLGTSYYVVSYGAQTNLNQLAVIATVDNTAVEITLPYVRDGPPMSVGYSCILYADGSSFTIRININEVFVISTLADLSGIKIVSSNPVAVFAGNTRTAVPTSMINRDHVAEQMISVGNWDNQYVYIPISRQNPTGDLVRLIAGYNGTNINYQSTGQSSQSIRLDAGSWIELDLSRVTYFSSSSRFGVLIVTKSVANPSLGTDPVDPSTITISGLNQFATSCIVPAFRSAESSLNNQTPAKYPFNSLYVTIRTADATGLRMDNGPVSYRYPCELVPGNSDYSACVLQFDGQTSHRFSHASGARFGAFVYSADDRESLGSSVAFFSGVTVCENTVMRIGDKLDNDCDSFIDEELCDGVDNDQDGLIDEDCASSTGEAVGRTYVVTFTDNSKSDALPTDLDVIELYISPQNTDVDTVVNVSTPLATYHTSVVAPRNVVTLINVPKSFRLPPSSGLFNTGILVESSDNIVMYAMNKIRFSSESYVAIPLDSTGYEYYAVTYTVSDGNDVAEFAVCASEPGQTNVRITLCSIPGVSVDYLGINYRAGDVITVSINQYQCLQMQSPVDLTGSYIVSTNKKRISVFSGNRRAIVAQAQVASRDHMVEQLPQVDAWGREFYTNPIQRDGTDGRLRGDVFRIVASQPATQIVITSTGLSSGIRTISSPGGFVELGVGSAEFMMIQSNNPVLVMQYSKAQFSADANVDTGDASMALVIPKEAWSNSYRFVTPLSGQPDPNKSGAYLPYTSKMSILIEKDYISNLRFASPNGVLTTFSVAFSSAVWVDIPGAIPAVSATTVRVAFGQNFVTATDGKTFAATIYGAADREFYSNPISLRLSAASCVQTVNKMVIGDGIDNDCDQSVDEELLNGLDDDHDGLIDEDCGVPPDGSRYRYILVFMDNTVEYPKDLPLTIYVFAKVAGNTKLRMRTTQQVYTQNCDSLLTLAENQYRQLGVSSLYRLAGNGIFNNTILIESDFELGVAAFNKETFSCDGFLSIAYANLGSVYRSISYWPPTISTQFAVVAADATTVSVTLPRQTTSLANPSIVHPITGQNFTAGQTFSFTMRQYESVQIQSTGDLSGSTIRSSGGKLAVFSGNVRVGIGAKSRDHIVEQIPPWSSASTEWNVVANGMTETEVIKFVCDPGVTITFPASSVGQGQDTQFLFPDQSGKAESLTVPADYAARVSASGPCQLSLITKSQLSTTATRQADPTLTYIVPVGQYITSVLFTVPYASNGQRYNCTLVIITASSSSGSIRLDGSAVSGWQSVRNSFYSYIRVPVSSRLGPNKIESISSAVFEARLWGVADRESFSYPLGINLP